MEFQRRRHNMARIQDQENIYTHKGKENLALPIKRQGIRGVLGDVNTNVQTQRENNVGSKVIETVAECEKKVTQNTRACLRSNYGHVQSKIDTGLAVKNVVPSARPTLRREESTAYMAVRAATRPKAVLKENKVTKPKEAENGITEGKKVTQGVKKTSRQSGSKEEFKEPKQLKPILKESTESLGKLKLTPVEPVVPDSPEECLPQGVVDIDAADKKSPLLMSNYIKDIYEYLNKLEIDFPVERDHLRKHTEITPRMRSTLVDWLVEVAQGFSLVLETFQLSIGILDRYLQVATNLPRNRLQLVGVTALFIASKYEEIYSPILSDFVYITDNTYSKKDIIRCEIDILDKLGFMLAKPIPLVFLRRFVKAAQGTSKHHHLAKYFVDLTLVEYAHYRPSQLAAAALCLSLHLLSNKDLQEVWTPTLTYYSKYTLLEIEPIVKKIARLVVNGKGEKNKYKSVMKKYADVNLAKVSTLPVLKGDTIKKLIEEDD